MDAELPGELILYFDGSAEPNPGLATYGWAIMIQSGEEIACGCGVSYDYGSNNQSEYCALGFALRWLSDQGWKGTLQIFGDSKLVINQLTQEWRCNKEHLRNLRKRCWELLEGIEYKATWVPREQNDRCDSLSRKAYEERTGKSYPERRKHGKAKDQD